MSSNRGRLRDPAVYDVVSALPNRPDFEAIHRKIGRTRARVSVHRDDAAYSIDRRVRQGRCHLVLVSNDLAGLAILDDPDLRKATRIAVILSAVPGELERASFRREFRERGAFVVLFAPEVNRALLECLVDATMAHAPPSKAEPVRSVGTMSGRGTLTSVNLSRQLFFGSLQAMLEAPPGTKPFALLVVELDRYRALSSTLLTEGAAALLDTMSRRIKEAVDPSDTVAYLGDGRFGVLAPGPDRRVLVDQIQEAADDSVMIDDVPIHTGLSIGMTTSERTYQQPADAIRDAITAARHAVSKSPALYQTSMRLREVQELRLEAELRAAVMQQAFTLAYQPIVRLDTGAMVGFEALLRWTSPTRGFVSPAEFVPVLERTDLIVDLGAWILKAAARQAQDWNNEFAINPPLMISVNVSAKQLLHPNMVAHVQAALVESRIPPNCLKLEVTETATIEEPERVANTLSQCRGLGVQVWIDDFGTGYSSLAHVRHFPVDGLKIDKSFVDPIDGTQEGSVMAAAILGIARTIGASVVAEGIEEAAQATELRQLGCPYAQGYHFSKPLSLADAYVKLAETGQA